MTGGALRTPRLTLRPLRTEDAEPIARLIAEWDVIRWLTRPPHPFRLADAEAFIASGQGIHWAILLDGTFIGEVRTRPNLGYWLGLPWHGRGYMTEAARAAVTRHFDEGGGRLNSGYMPGNAASRKVLEKLGFRPGPLEMEWANSHGREVEVQRMYLDAP